MQSDTLLQPTDMPRALSALPDATQTAVAHAIATTFPTHTLQSVEQLHGGLSGTLIYKITIDHRPYVLRVVLQRTPFNDPARQFVSMTTAADIGVAPAVLFADVQTGVSISAFIVPPTATTASTPGIDRDATQLGALIRQLHHGPAFPVFMDAFQLIDVARAQLAGAGVVLPSIVREVLAEYESVKTVVAPYLTMVPCHNDLNPGNVLSDGQRLWLIDWDGACMGDPLFDIAGLMHWFALDETRTSAMLTAYFNGAPGAQQLAKLRLMEQVSWTFYMLVFLLISQGPDGIGDLERVSRDALPSFNEALREIKNGQLRLQDAEGRRRLSLVMARQALTDIAKPEFAAAMRELRALPAS